MKELFNLFHRYGATLVFFILEIICISAIVNKENGYQRIIFLSSSNQIISYVDNIKYRVIHFLQLRKHNTSLLKENATLKERIRKLSHQKQSVLIDSFNIHPFVNFKYTPARIINKSVFRPNNYITIDKGKKQEIMINAGVVSRSGSIVGIIKNSSENFSTVYSILHQNISISSQLKKNKIICSTKWKNINYKIANLFYLPRDVIVHKGDTVVTSGYNSIFPENILIGKVSKVGSSQESMFQDIEITLFTNFLNLSYVYVLQNNEDRKEKNQLERDIIE